MEKGKTDLSGEPNGAEGRQALPLQKLKVGPGICFVIDDYVTPNAGTEGQLFLLAQGLYERGWKVKLASFRGSEYLDSGQFPVPVEVLGIRRISSPGDWLKLARFLKQSRALGYDVVHAFFNDASLMAPPLAKLNRMKAIISRRDMGFWYTPWLKQLLRLSGRFVDACVCNSKAVRNMTMTEEKLSSKQLRVIYNGYREASVYSSRPLKKYSEKSTVVGIVANLRRIKRLDTLIRAIRLLREQDYPVEAHFVGGAGDAEDVKKLAETLGVSSSCRFWGSQPNPGAFIADFDIAVLCSESEGFSNAIIEYMQYGKPVVCTRVGGNPEIVEHGVNGYLIEVGDIDALAGHIKFLVDNPDKRKMMGGAAKQLVARRFQLENMLSDYEALYKGLASNVNQAG